MKYKSKSLRKLVSVIVKFKDKYTFDFTGSGLRIQGGTQAQMREIRRFFPGTIWKKEWVKGCDWWDYNSKWMGIPLTIWAVSEAPKTCKAIMETQTVTEQVPTGYRTVTHEREVLVGYDCGRKAKK